MYMMCGVSYSSLIAFDWKRWIELKLNQEGGGGGAFWDISEGIVWLDYIFCVQVKHLLSFVLHI